MNTYHKIQTIYKREPKGDRRLIEGQFSLPEFEYLKDNEWEYTEKVDGMNIRVLWIDEALSFRGKTDRAILPADLMSNLNTLFEPQNMYRTFEDTNVCLYGEGYGAGIQKGGCYRPDKSFVLFDIKIGSWWLRRPDVEKVAQELNIDVVPIIGRGTLSEAVEMVRKGIKSTWGDFLMEGLVLRPAVELRTRNRGRLIAKIKTRDFK